jgi:hypothetical protein
MIRIANIFKNNRQMKSLSGLSIAEFDILLVSFEIILYEYFAKRSRKRAVGRGRKVALLDAADILFYIKTYPTYDLGGFV